jgi:hypothetical protein
MRDYASSFAEARCDVGEREARMTNHHNRPSNRCGSFAKAGVWLYIVAIGFFTFAAVELEKCLSFHTV